MLDFPAAANALWSLYDATGIRPEWLLPPLYYESAGFQNVQNFAGYPYYGVNQASVQMLSGYGITPDQYLAMPISEQIRRVVTPEFVGLQQRYGPLRSGLRIYQANFLPATLPVVKSLDGVLATQGHDDWGAGDVYGANAGFDTQHKGTIVLGDLAAAVQKSAAAPAVVDALRQTYAARPQELPFKRDPVYGDDFGMKSLMGKPVAVVVVLGGLGLLAWSIHTGALGRWARRYRVPVLRSVVA